MTRERERIVQCERCGLYMVLEKDGTLPKHYVPSPCGGSGTTSFKDIPQGKKK